MSRKEDRRIAENLRKHNSLMLQFMEEGEK